MAMKRSKANISLNKMQDFFTLFSVRRIKCVKVCAVL